jgi:hypothetical protein
MDDNGESWRIQPHLAPSFQYDFWGHRAFTGVTISATGSAGGAGGALTEKAEIS